MHYGRQQHLWGCCVAQVYNNSLRNSRIQGECTIYAVAYCAVLIYDIFKT